jgi:hypothetical protein
MTPKMPSDPRNTLIRSGPAAEPGDRPSSMSPVGVATRIPVTIESKRPLPAEFCPDDRAAAKPPIVA